MNNSYWGEKRKTWLTISYYFDLETGEKITQQQAETFYTITKKTKIIYAKKAQMVVEITNHCRRNATKQLDIFEENLRQRQASRKRSYNWYATNKRNERR